MLFIDEGTAPPGSYFCYLLFVLLMLLLFVTGEGTRGNAMGMCVSASPAVGGRLLRSAVLQWTQTAGKYI